MKKVKITESQYNKLFTSNLDESTEVKGGINRVNKQFKKAFAGSGVKNLSEDNFDIKAPIPGIPNSKMKMQKEPSSLDENILNPEVQQAVSHLIHNIWLNPSQHGLSPFFKQNGITWGDIMDYLTAVGVVSGVAGGGIKLRNYFNTKFNKNPKIAEKEKELEVKKIADDIAKDKKAPWNKINNQAPSANTYNPNRFKPLTSTSNDEKAAMMPYLDPDNEGMPFLPDDPNYTNRSTSNDPEDLKPYLDPDNEGMPFKNTDEQFSPESENNQMFKPVGMNKDIVILNGPDGLYVFDYDNLKLDGLNANQLAQYVNKNFKSLSRGRGLKDLDTGIDLIKMDEKLREKLAVIYGKDKQFVHLLNRVEEMTGAASSGAFTGPLGGSGNGPKIDKNNTPANALISDEEEFLGGKKIEEMTTASTGNAQSSASGQYVQPAIWAKNEKNFAGNKKTQYPNGEMVKFDPCTRLNNNKSAQNGKCSQGAVDNVVKTYKTKDSVISKANTTVYETIAKKTGKSVKEVKRIIETKVLKNKPL